MLPYFQWKLQTESTKYAKATKNKFCWCCMCFDFSFIQVFFFQEESINGRKSRQWRKHNSCLLDSSYFHHCVFSLICQVPNPSNEKSEFKINVFLNMQSIPDEDGNMLWNFPHPITRTLKVLGNAIRNRTKKKASNIFFAKYSNETGFIGESRSAPLTEDFSYYFFERNLVR